MGKKEQYALAIKETKEKAKAEITKAKSESASKTGTTVIIGAGGAIAHGAIKALGDDLVTVGGMGTADLAGFAVSLYVGYEAINGRSSPFLAPAAIGMTAPALSARSQEFFKGVKAQVSPAKS